MSKLPVLTGKEPVKILEKLGFRAIRQEGSHAFLRHKNDGRTTVVPLHPAKA